MDALSSETILEDNVQIDPYVVTIWSCKIWSWTQIMSHTYIQDSQIGSENIIKPGAVIMTSQTGWSCKLWCEMTNCTLGDKVMAVHSNIILENIHTGSNINISGWVMFASFAGKRVNGKSVKSTLLIWDRVFIWLNTALIPSSKRPEMKIGSNVFIAWSINLRHDVPDNSTVYPTPLAKKVAAHRELPIHYENDEYTILDWNKIEEEDLLIY